MKKLLIFGLLVSFSMALAGCTDGGPKLVPAGGTVTFNGSPLARANVLVHYPDRSTATGITDAAGKFTLVYSNGKPGAAVGNALPVTVRKTEEQQSITTTGDPIADQKAMVMGAQKTAEASGGKVAPAPAKNLVPPKYADPATTDVKIDIPAGGNEKLEIKLTS